MAKTVKRKKVNRRNQKRSVALNWDSAWHTVRPLMVLSLLAAIAYGGLQTYQWLMKPTTLPIRHVQVEGDLSHVDPQQLQAQIKTQVSGGFFSLDIENIMRELKTNEWVYDVSLRRLWPNRLLITIEEQLPIARWSEGFLLNQYGEVFAASGDYSPEALPLISGETGRETDLILFFNQADRLLHPLQLKMVELKEDARGDQRLLLDSGIELALGRKNRMQRLERFASAYGKTLRPFMERIEALDLRYANGFAVRWNHNPQQYAETQFNRI
jgi:cell division protein FtsQ